MSTLPLDNIRPRLSAPSFFKRGVLWIATFTAIGVLIYSGTAWLWLRPVLHKTLINKYAGEYKYDPLWVMSIIRVESRFAPSAHSSRGALGLMQLLPSTAGSWRRKSASVILRMMI